MADRYRIPGGWTVEIVQVAVGQRLRIRHHGFHVVDVVNVDDLGHAGAGPVALWRRHRARQAAAATLAGSGQVPGAP